jgi:hypothetical protein
MEIRYALSHLGSDYLYDNTLERHVLITPESNDPASKVAISWICEGKPIIQDDRIASWYKVRKERQKLLLSSDWTVLPDSPVINKEEWMEYRQKLRNLTESYERPWDVIWPEVPSLVTKKTES